jgi:hypothetical protein
MTSHNPSHQDPWICQQGRDVATPGPRQSTQGTTDAHGIDEYGMAIATPGEWLPNFDDAFDLDFGE